MSTSNKSYYSIEKLNASNYHTWAIRAQMVLMEKELWVCVTGVKMSIGKEAEGANAQLRAEKEVFKTSDDH